MSARLFAFACACAIAGHFSLMLLQVSHGYDWLAEKQALPALREFADQYRVITSANRNFRFFAPSVADNWHIQLLLHDQAGRTRPASLPASSRELVVRQHAMMDHFFRDRVAMDRYARAWAAHSFAHDTSIAKVTVIVERNVSPGLQDYRAGQRLRREELMRATYVR
jgi:hypothetical protein